MPLRDGPNGLEGPNSVTYPYITEPETGIRFPLFNRSLELGASATKSLEMYHVNPEAVVVYRNFLDWLFNTFSVDPPAFRAEMIGRLRLKHGDSALITGCGVGDEIPALLESVGADGVVFAQDLSPSMVSAAIRYVVGELGGMPRNLHFFAGDATELPIPDKLLDGAYHFGGINLFDDIAAALSEMSRVTRSRGRVVVGDEGVAPWLRDSELGKIAINNNQLWAREPPLKHLPQTCTGVSLEWILGNCFYVLSFSVSESEPAVNLDIPHKGRRGGTMRTRYFGQLEGVMPETKKAVLEAASLQGVSVHDWLENAISRALK
jgi:SAM-dependent methyltransferase